MYGWNGLPENPDLNGNLEFGVDKSAVIFVFVDLVHSLMGGWVGERPSVAPCPSVLVDAL